MRLPEQEVCGRVYASATSTGVTGNASVAVGAFQILAAWCETNMRLLGASGMGQPCCWSNS